MNRISLSHNALKSLPRKVGIIELQILILYALLIPLKRDFSQFYECTEVDLSHNNFTNFAVCFTMMYNLNVIDLSYNKFTTLSELEMERMPKKEQILNLLFNWF